MALIWFDGFETYDGVADMRDLQGYPFSGTLTDSFTDFTTTNGRRGGAAMGFSNQTGHITYYLSDFGPSIVVGGAVMQITSGTPSYSSSYPMIGFSDSGTYQFRLHAVGTEIQARHGDGTLLGTTSGAGIAYGVWVYIEVKLTIDNSAGIVEVRSNGNTVLSLTSQDTQNTANSTFNRLRFGTVYYPQARWDDIYLLDNTGSKNNDFLGDIRIDSIRPDSAGTYTQFTPLSGSNYENVDETFGHDSDTSYNYSNTVGHKDSYNLGSLEALGTPIKGVKSQITIRKDDAGNQRAKLLTRSGTTEDLGDRISLSDSYTTHVKLFEVNPDDSNDWEEADINSMEVGVMLVSSTTTTTTTT